MKSLRIQSASVATVLLLLTTGCGAEETTTAGQDSPSSREPASAGGERITPGGIAVVVLDHLGRDHVRQVVTFTEEEEGEGVGVMVRLRDRTPHNFSISVYPPEQGAGFPEAGKCPPLPNRKEESSRCRVLDDGTTVMTSKIGYGFSDDNTHGSLLTGSVITPDKGAAMAMYESYDSSPSISVADLEGTLTDPRLTWLTDPEVNKAGEAVPVKEITG